MRRTDAELRSIRARVQWIGQLSDNIIRLGPFSLGVDGVLSWIPGVGELYSLGAGAFILIQGARAGVPVPVLAGAALILGVRTAGDTVPIAGAIFSDLFTAHKWASRMIVAAIDRRLNDPVPPGRQPPRRWGPATA